MGALITLPPARVDTSSLASNWLSAIDDEYAGPYFFGGTWFSIFAATIVGAATNLINVFASVDRATWTPQDQVHAPPNANTALQSYNVYFDGLAGVIYLAYQTGSALNTLSFSSFNLTTRLWTNTAFPDITGMVGFGAAYSFVRRTDGSIVLAYMDSILGTAYRVNTAGVWAAAASLTASSAASTKPSNLFLDPVTQITHVIYYVPGVAQPASNEIWNYVTISNAAAGNVLGVPAMITAGINKPGGDAMFRGVIWQNSLVAPLVRQTQSPAGTRLTVFIGTPLSAPVWSVVDIEVLVNTSGTIFIYANLFVDASGALYVIAGLDPTSAVPVQIVWAKNTGSGFSPLALFYDAVVNPPAGPIAPFEFIAQVALGINPAGDIAGLLNFSVASSTLGAFALRGAGVAPSTGVNIVLGLKGMKVYKYPPETSGVG